MGVWVPGNFESGTVADSLGEVTDRIIADIAEQFDATPDDCALEPDEWGGEMVRWDGYIDGLEPTPEHEVARRAVVVDTFDRAVALAAERAGD
ncbi:DUF4259 domain-containing protein [Rhodococcus sp. (in: high G+C Gram-positive bacteria)]|uniref:DUF4259 domain-containing protein n=1 Tax=Rhodococcus sp. TaxID=1831 RepID=UPI003B8A6445